jgi:hypothetical protein
MGVLDKAHFDEWFQWLAGKDYRDETHSQLLLTERFV